MPRQRGLRGRTPLLSVLIHSSLETWTQTQLHLVSTAVQRVFILCSSMSCVLPVSGGRCLCGPEAGWSYIIDPLLQVRGHLMVHSEPGSSCPVLVLTSRTRPQCQEASQSQSLSNQLSVSNAVELNLPDLRTPLLMKTSLSADEDLPRLVCRGT